MRERTLIRGAILLCLLFLAGCRAGNIAKFDADDFSKAQKIVVRDAAGAERAVLTSESDIDISFSIPQSASDYLQGLLA